MDDWLKSIKIPRALRRRTDRRYRNRWRTRTVKKEKEPREYETYFSIEEVRLAYEKELEREQYERRLYDDLSDGY